MNWLSRPSWFNRGTRAALIFHRSDAPADVAIVRRGDDLPGIGDDRPRPGRGHSRRPHPGRWSERIGPHRSACHRADRALGGAGTADHGDQLHPVRHRAVVPALGARFAEHAGQPRADQPVAVHDVLRHVADVRPRLAGWRAPASRQQDHRGPGLRQDYRAIPHVHGRSGASQGSPVVRGSRRDPQQGQQSCPSRGRWPPRQKPLRPRKSISGF